MVFYDHKLESLERWIESIFLYITITVFILRVLFDLLAQRLLGDKRCLYWKNVLITNASSAISQELKIQLKENYRCNVVMIDKNFEYLNNKIYKIDFRNNIEAQHMLNTIINRHGPFDILICNEIEYTEEFCTKENENIRDFLTLFVNLIPKMHETGGGQIISLKSSNHSLQSLVQCRQDYGLLAKELIRHLPNNLSFFSLSIVKCPQNFKNIQKLVAQIVTVIEKRKKVTEVSDSSSIKDTFIAFIEKCWIKMTK